jgi:4-hydroxy-3-polyprenylbenzoate decarboxylase
MSPKEPQQSSLPIVLAITGASGAVYAARTLQWLLLAKRQIHLVVSPDGATVVRQELGFDAEFALANIEQFLLTADSFLSEGAPTKSDQWVHLRESLAAGWLQVHHPSDYFAPIASGSYRTAAMVVCPCSGSTLSSIAHASGRNLIHRAAEVHMKERRKLVLVPRETPLSTLQIDNMLRLSSAGAVILPASPGWYHGVKQMRDLVDFVASRILDQLDVAHQHIRRWGDA